VPPPQGEEERPREEKAKGIPLDAVCGWRLPSLSTGASDMEGFLMGAFFMDGEGGR